MKRITVELSPVTWLPHVREAFEKALLPMFSAGIVDGLQMSWDAKHTIYTSTYTWRAWEIGVKYEHSTHRFEYAYRLG